MPSELISESIIARLVIKSLLPFVHEETSPFRCSWIANVEPEDRRMTVDDFVAWHVSPMVRSAICYADDGAGKELTKNASYGGSVHEFQGVQARAVIGYDVFQSAHWLCIDARYPV